jgi:hypothetical protein
MAAPPIKAITIRISSAAWALIISKATLPTHLTKNVHVAFMNLPNFR